MVPADLCRLRAVGDVRLHPDGELIVYAVKHLDSETDANRSLLTNTLLKQLIRFYNSDIQPFVRSYLEQSLAGFLEQQETMQHMVKNMVDSSPVNLFNKMMEQNMKMWDPTQKPPKSGGK